MNYDYLRPLISTIDYEIYLVRRLLDSDYRYYIPYIITSMLKHFSDLIMSYETGTPTVSYRYTEILKSKLLERINSITYSLITECIEVSRKKDSLICNISRIDVNKLLDIVNIVEKYLIDFVQRYENKG
ncbi:MAG: hypothetical protein N2712_04085 [Brevinematales bacterium]|nr:hypothetical protein [Brevinematales bacterium]